MLGNAVAPRIRARLREEHMLIVALIGTTVGRNLARRAIVRAENLELTLEALTRANAQVEHTPARELVEHFYEDLAD